MTWLGLLGLVLLYVVIQALDWFVNLRESNLTTKGTKEHKGIRWS